ncbi:hypothetical protein A2774_03070 [Candidatus Roizmanbacteria bacterium RIFCSPHIGHO2_01_FULL_39_12c]|uniref:Uncharacterized protein n=1 Tax=Candidatus Roizmanbacteria bacterium RIFCSPHIGHO2_01_FULL_39_12c TaxID=1802031 RepID=A0A1F7GCW4_9BACT|nr:MAG: hypothetical protein A2774_03070 [Candidatus Roizmanbacteria bacterium RIFCSPHIGHO2_01_FULL_39_12c]OGK47419.1 MAG: hypothetical protein A2963_04670 [Candidatus Roizmanbacteria bacterium RIFCSPLOWO2_01_FULL_40_13]
MLDLSLDQKKSLSQFFSNMAVLFFGAALISPAVVNFLSVIELIKYLIVGILFLLMSLKVLN